MLDKRVRMTYTCPVIGCEEENRWFRHSERLAPFFKTGWEAGLRENGGHLGAPSETAAYPCVKGFEWRGFSAAQFGWYHGDLRPKCGAEIIFLKGCCHHEMDRTQRTA